jgi:hypothetical protein
MATDTKAARGASRMAGSARRNTSERRPSQERRRAGKHHGHVVSQAPGRIRVRLHREHRSSADLQQIERDLSQQDGVTSVATNARTGSVLVHYDRHALSNDDLMPMLHDAGIVAAEILGADEVAEDLAEGVVEHSSTASGIMDALTDLDRRLSEATGGRVDIKLLVPAGLSLLALRQIMTSGFGLAEVPGYVLLWYTFDSFYKLHQRKSVAIAEKAAEQAHAADPDTTVVAVSEVKTSGS